VKEQLLVLLVLALTASAQQRIPPATSCPVYASLATSNWENHIVIWYWNQGRKTIHGVQFKLVMLDSAGNRYPASQLYQAKGEVKPQHGDVVLFSEQEERKYLGGYWDSIDGVEVYVTNILFADATTWLPEKGRPCKTAFLNDNYDAALRQLRKRLATSPQR
jgi:hypothetical protein